MLCDAVRQQLQLYRELDEGEREAIQRHLDGCPVCMAVWEQYQAQDRVLASLPSIVPARDWAAQVRARTTDQHMASGNVRRHLATNLSIIALALMVTLGGTLGVSAQALPGSGLYPVKLAVEQARLTLIVSETRREAYRHELEAKRREEVRAVAERTTTEPVQVAFGGTLTEVHDGVWIIDGIRVAVEPGIAAAGATLIGQQVAVDARAGDGVVTASAVYVEPTPTAALPTQAAPTARPSGTPLSSATGRPVVDAIRATATAFDLTSTRVTQETPASASAVDTSPTPRSTRRATRVPGKVVPTQDAGMVTAIPTEGPYIYPTRQPTALLPTRVPTQAPVDMPTPHMTRIATPRMTRVAPPGKGTEPTLYPTWAATKRPTLVATTQPTAPPTSQPTRWHKPATVCAPVTVGATLMAPGPTAAPPMATPRVVQEPTVAATAACRPTSHPGNTPASVREPAPTSAPTSAPAQTTAPVETGATPQGPAATPRPTDSSADTRVPGHPPTPIPTPHHDDADDVPGSAARRP